MPSQPLCHRWFMPPFKNTQEHQAKRHMADDCDGWPGRRPYHASKPRIFQSEPKISQWCGALRKTSEVKNIRSQHQRRTVSYHCWADDYKAICGWTALSTTMFLLFRSLFYGGSVFFSSEWCMMWFRFINSNSESPRQHNWTGGLW